jgi:hypothetical protein
VIRVLQPSATSVNQSIYFYQGTKYQYAQSNVSFSGLTASATAESLATFINSQVNPYVPVKAYWNGGNDVLVQAINSGVSDIRIDLRPSGSNRDVSGFALVAPTGYGPASTSRYLLGGEDVPVNAARVSDAPTPIAMTGLTERLPLGILLNDADFIGEDPARSGFSMLHVAPSAGGPAGNVKVPEVLGAEYDRLSGPAGHIGMADGGVLLYTAWTTVTPTGSRFFRVYRGCSAYVIGGQNPGGPVDWASGNLPDGSVLKGCVLAGRAYLVRNYEESAFGDVTSHGDEIQMVIVTRGIVGESLDCENGYALVGQISPTGYGEGYSAADRYRLEGKPLHAGTSKNGPNPVVPLAPYPTDDPQPATPC